MSEPTETMGQQLNRLWEALEQELGETVAQLEREIEGRKEPKWIQLREVPKS